MKLSWTAINYKMNKVIWTVSNVFYIIITIDAEDIK